MLINFTVCKHAQKNKNFCRSQNDWSKLAVSIQNGHLLLILINRESVLLNSLRFPENKLKTLSLSCDLGYYLGLFSRLTQQRLFLPIVCFGVPQTVYTDLSSCILYKPQKTRLVNNKLKINKSQHTRQYSKLSSSFWGSIKSQRKVEVNSNSKQK